MELGFFWHFTGTFFRYIGGKKKNIYIYIYTFSQDGYRNSISTGSISIGSCGILFLQGVPGSLPKSHTSNQQTTLSKTLGQRWRYLSSHPCLGGFTKKGAILNSPNYSFSGPNRSMTSWPRPQFRAPSFAMQLPSVEKITWSARQLRSTLIPLPVRP